MAVQLLPSDTGSFCSPSAALCLIIKTSTTNPRRKKRDNRTVASPIPLWKPASKHYNYFRDYDPAIGKYLKSDPIGLQGGSNTYTYVNATPLVLSDPLGLAALGGGGKFDCVANCIREGRFDPNATLCTLVTAFGFGKMPKTGGEAKGGFGPRDKHSPWTSQPSRWQRRGFWLGRAFGQSLIGGVLGGAATALLVGEGFYDTGTIARCLIVCANDSSAY
jgi:hypothetical protein